MLYTACRCDVTWFGNLFFIFYWSFFLPFSEFEGHVFANLQIHETDTKDRSSRTALPDLGSLVKARLKILLFMCHFFLLIIFKWNWDNCCIWLCTTDFRALVIIVLNLWFHDNMFCFAPVCWAFSFHILVFLLLEFCTSIQCRWT